MMVISGTLFAVGLVLDSSCWSTFISRDYTLPDPSTTVPHLGVLGLMLMIVGFSTFCFTLLLHATSVSYGAAGDSD